MKQECKKLKEVIGKLDSEFNDLKDEVDQTQQKKDLFENRRNELAENIKQEEINYADQFSKQKNLESALREAALLKA